MAQVSDPPRVRVRTVGDIRQQAVQEAIRRTSRAREEPFRRTHRGNSPSGARLIADPLRDFGCDEIVEGVGGTGVAGVVRGTRSAGSVILELRS
jgi:hippurate hydrolase